MLCGSRHTNAIVSSLASNLTTGSTVPTEVAPADGSFAPADTVGDVRAVEDSPNTSVMPSMRAGGTRSSPSTADRDTAGRYIEPVG
jgi:hypothetical protein